MDKRDKKYNNDNRYKNDRRKEKVKVELERDIVNELIRMKEVGDTYSDVIRTLMETRKKR